MTEINYNNILEELAKILITDERTQKIDGATTNIIIEEQLAYNSDSCPCVYLHLDSIDIPEDEEMIGGVNPFKVILTIKITLIQFALDKKISSELRDKLHQKVKEVLKVNRTINSTVLISTFGKGDFIRGEIEGFFSGFTFDLNCEIRE